MSCRKGEAEKHWYRAGRFFQANGAWYFTTREQIEIGPFGTMQSAENGLSIFIKNVESGLSYERAAASITVDCQWASKFYH